MNEREDTITVANSLRLVVSAPQRDHLFQPVQHALQDKLRVVGIVRWPRSAMPGKGRRAALILASSRPPKGIKKAREVTKVTCQEELTSLMVSVPHS